jgi:hypothetical protein
MFTPILVFGQDQVYFSETWTQDGGESALFYKNSSTTDDAGNVYMAGSAININNNHDIIIQKFDPDGGLLWEEIFNGAANMDDFAADVFVDDNYDVFITGSSVKLAANDQDLVVLKYNSSGVFQWYSYYDNGGGPTPKDFGTSITGDNNGSVYVTGGSFGATSNSDFITLGIASNNGAQLWEKRYDYAALQDVAAKIKYDGNNLFVSGGSQINFNRWELATLTYNPLNGDQLYERRSQGNATQGIDEVYDLTVDDLGNVYIAGAVRNLNSGYDMSVYKLDPQLNIIWEKHHDGYGDDDKGKGVKVDDLGNVYLAGFVSNPNEGKNYSLLKYNSSGVLQWAREFNGQANLDDEAVQLVIANNQDVFVTGTARNNANADFQTLGYKPNGELFTQAIFEGINGLDDMPTGIAMDLTGNIIVAGKMGEANGNYRDVTVKYSLLNRHWSTIIPLNGEGAYLNNNLILRFDKSKLNLSNIDRKSFVAGQLDEFVNLGLISQMNKILGFNCNRLKTYKVHRNATSADSLSYTRLGDTILLPDFWASLIIEIPEGYNELLIADTLETIFGIHNAQLEYVYKTNSVPNDMFYLDGYQLGLHSNLAYPNADIDVEGAWGIIENEGGAYGASDLRVGVYDFLIDYSHFEFGSSGTLMNSKINGGRNYHTGLTDISNANTLTNSHGTQAAGIIGAHRNDGAGIAGIAGGDLTADPINGGGVQLYSLGVFYNNFVATSSIIAESLIEGSTLTNNNYGFGLHIANHSYGRIGNYSNEEAEALEISWRNQTINVFARGNEGHAGNPLEFPACYINEKWLINVIASGDDGERKIGTTNGAGIWSSSFGRDANINYPPSAACFVDVMAPGVNSLVSTTSNQFDNTSNPSNCNVPNIQNNSNYSCFNGTSAAVPHVSGVAALMYSSHDPNFHWEYKNRLTTEDIENVLEKTTQKTLNQYDHSDGYGLIDAREAVKQVTKPYSVRHLNFKKWHATSIQHIGTTTPTNGIRLYAAEEALGIPDGTYFDRAEKYKASWDVGYTPSGNRQIIDWWKVESRIFGGQSAGGSLNSQNYFYQNEPLFIENFTVDLINNSVSGTVDGYYWKFIRSNGTFIWLPENPNQNLQYTFALHLLDETLNIEDEIIDEKIYVYPNPSNIEINVENIPLSAVINSFSIYDPTGRLVKTVPISSSSKEYVINIESLSDGLYYLHINGVNYKSSTKFLKN